jgi:hypothetical protein
LNDLAYNESSFDAVKEEVVKTSLLRDLNRKTVTKQFRRIAHGGAILTNYDFDFNVQSGD